MMLEQREVCCSGAPSGGELEFQPSVDRHVAVPGTGCPCLPTEASGGLEAIVQETSLLQGDVHEEDAARCGSCQGKGKDMNQ
ncbi:hypothetical protein EJ110_NYTH36995 [Nymphaea thermarum]|nr:hypothetical protein EJ110_NYTH36995 [Nymphaea thermarum]